MADAKDLREAFRNFAFECNPSLTPDQLETVVKRLMQETQKWANKKPDTPKTEPKP